MSRGGFRGRGGGGFGGRGRGGGGFGGGGRGRGFGGGGRGRGGGGRFDRYDTGPPETVKGLKHLTSTKHFFSAAFA